MSLPDRYRRDGCTSQRGRNSVFCEEHHREQLVRVALLSDAPRDPCAGLRRTCDSQVMAFQRSLITADELYGSLYDAFVHYGIQGLIDCWDPCLAALPKMNLNGLLTYAKGLSEPRLFHPRPTDEQRRAEVVKRAVEVQVELLTRIETKLQLDVGSYHRPL